MMQNADIAMYLAKAQGYNRYQVYDALMRQDFKKALEIETLLRQTVADRDFELYTSSSMRCPLRSSLAQRPSSAGIAPITALFRRMFLYRLPSRSTTFSKSANGLCRKLSVRPKVGMINSVCR